MSLGVIDYIIFGLTIFISVAISLYYRFTGGKQRTNQEYLLGNKKQSVIPVAFSLVANFASSISILGYTSEVYNYGTHFFVINVAYMISTPVAVIFYLPVIMKNNTISVYEYFEKRFGHLTRLVASMAFTLQMVLYMGVVHYAPALAIETVTGIPQIHSILSVGFICICYSAIGGMKAVIINDVFQSLLMFAAIYAIIIVSIIDAGSVGEIWKQANMHDRIQFSNFNLDPTERHSWWTVVIGGFFTHITVYTVNQAQVQRYVSMSSYKNAAWALMLSAPILILFMSSLCITGLCLFYFYRNCDPVKEGRISLADQLVPLYVMDRFNNIPGLTGLFVAGIFAASLSTVSAAVNSLAAVTLEDYLKPLYKHIYRKELKSNNSNLSKFLAFVYGIVCLIVAMVIRNYESLLQTCLVVFGMVGGPMFGLFTAGTMLPIVNQFGAVSGFLIGLIFCFVIGFGGPKPKAKRLPTEVKGCKNIIQTAVHRTFSSSLSGNLTSSVRSTPDDFYYLFKISYLYYIALGFFITLTVSVLLSLIYGDSNKVKEPEHFTPLVARFIRRRKPKKETIYVCDIEHQKEVNI